MANTRRTVIALLSVLIILAAAAIFLWTSLDALVAAAIEKYGSQATQTKVRVASVDIALTAGEASIAGLTIGNPPGFSTPHAFSLKEISTRIDTKSVTGSPILIEEIRVQAPQVYYEINRSGESNVLEIKKRLGQGGGSKNGQEQTGPHLIIRRLIIEQGRVEGRVAAIENRTFSAQLPRIELTGLGEETNGAPAGQIAREVASALVQRASATVGQLGVSEYLGKSTEQIQEELESKATESLEQGKEKSLAPLKKMLDR